VAHVKSHAMWPGAITPKTCNWRQHKGQACGRDYSEKDADFKKAPNITVATSSTDSSNGFNVVIKQVKGIENTPGSGR